MTDSIAELMALSEDDLLDKLGLELERSSPGVKPLSRRERVEEATNWLSKNRDRIAKSVCNDARIKAFQSSSRTRDRIQLAAAFLDVLAAVFGVVGPATVSVLLAKEGLDTLCPQTADKNDKTA